MTSNKLVMELKGFRLGDYSVPMEEDFTVDKAHQLLDAHMRRRDGKHEKIKLKVYNDHIRVAKGSFFADVKQDHYHLDNIHRFFVFKNDPQLLILGLFNHGKKSFVLLHFKSASQTNMLCDHIERVKGPGKQSGEILGDNSEMIQNKPLETFVVTEEPEIRHTEQVVVCERPPTPKQIDSVIVDEIQPDYTTRVETIAVTSNNGYYDDEVAIYPPDYDRDSETYDHKPKKIDNDLLRTNANGNWREDMQYIDYNPKYGSIVSDNGPIYMYTANQIVPEYRGYSVCVSSSSSSSSSDDDEDDYRRRQKELKDHPVVYDNDGAMYAGASSSFNASFSDPSVSAELNGGNDHYGMRY